MTSAETALLELGKELQKRSYRFITPTPATHQRVVDREGHDAQAHTLRDIFGWSQRFRREALPPALFRLLEQGDALTPLADRFFRSQVRFSSLREVLFIHSSFPTEADDSVFFGPDTYRFEHFVRTQLQLQGRDSRDLGRVVDLGCGSGAGGLLLGHLCRELVLTDVNSKALSYAKINEGINSIASIAKTGDPVSKIQFVKSDLFQALSGNFDVVIANPPFLVDSTERAYRHGGANFGTELTVRIVKESIKRLNPSGLLFLYSAAAIQEGKDLLWAELEPMLSARKTECSVDYFEIDPDIFGEELESQAYASVERIAAIGLVVKRLES